MPTDTIERAELPLEIETETEHSTEYDQRALKLLETFHAVTMTLEAVHNVKRRSDEPLGCLQDYVDDLEAAFRAGQQLIERDDLDAIVRDLSRLEDETLVELRGTLAYVAPHFGIDVELPAPSEGGE